MGSRNLGVPTSTGGQSRSHHPVVIVVPQEPKLSQECLWVLHLDRGNQLIERELVLAGVVTHSVIRPQEILRKAIAYGTARIITLHCHPHSTIELSLEDLQIWRTLELAAEAKGIAHLDHLVVSVSGGQISCRQVIEQGYARGTENNAQKGGARKRVKADRSTIRQVRSA
jgi:hypothetical protein